MNGTVRCWRSNNVTAAISPPSYLRFAQISCWTQPEQTFEFHVCGILTNTGLVGRLVCWVAGFYDYSNRDDFIMYPPFYWMYVYLFESIDPLSRQRLWEEWRNDTSTLAQACRRDPIWPEPPPLLPERSVFKSSREYIVVQQLTQLIFHSVTCARDSYWCTLLTVSTSAAPDETVYLLDPFSGQLIPDQSAVVHDGRSDQSNTRTAQLCFFKHYHRTADSNKR